jgi:hypothetical protein
MARFRLEPRLLPGMIAVLSYVDPDVFQVL